MNDSYASARSKLLSLKLRVPVGIARQVAQRLQNGETIYSIVGRKPDIGPVSKGTAVKIKRLLGEGKLGFLFDLQLEEDALNATAYSADYIQPSFRGVPFFDKINAEGLNQRTLDLWENLPKVDWTMESLESAGITTEDSLTLLRSYVDLVSRMGEWKLADLDRFAEIHHIVSFQKENTEHKNPGPYGLVNWAASVYSQGVVESNVYKVEAGKGIMRFQVWRGPAFLRAYEESQAPTHRAAREAKRQMMENMVAQFPELTAPLEETTND